MKGVEEAKLRLALLKENFEYRDFFSQFLDWDKRRKDTGVWPGLGFDKFGLTGLRRLIHHPSYSYDKIIELINPQVETCTTPDALTKRILPRLFYEHAVEVIEMMGTEFLEIEHGRIRPISAILHVGRKPDSQKLSALFEAGFKPFWEKMYKIKSRLKPWERIYKVDLTKKKSQILEEFKTYLEAALENSGNSDWAPYKKRQREEAWIHLAIWKLRRQRKHFSEIATELDVTIDAAKKSFYRAYELTQGRRYDRERFKGSQEVRKTDIKRICDTCPQRESCNDLCPDIIRFIDQDEIEWAKKAILVDTDNRLDFLIQKQL